MFTNLATAMLLISVAVMIKNIYKDWLHPAVTFPLTWGVILSLCALAMRFGYLGIAINAISIYFLGIFFFILGAIIGTDFTSRLSRRQHFDTDSFNYERLFKMCLLLHVIFLPLCLLEIKRITGGTTDLYAIAYNLRVLSVAKEDVVNPFVGNYLLSSLVFIPILAIGVLSNRLSIAKAMITSLPWALLILLVGGRSGLMTLLTALVYHYLVIGKAFSKKALIAFFASFAFVVIAGALLVSKIEVTLADGIIKVLSASVESFFDYALQGPILFSRYVTNEISIYPTWDAFVFISQLAEKFGLGAPGELQQDYAAFRVDGPDGNVYSIFLSILPKYGFPGVVLILFSYGFWAAYHHIRSKNSVSLIDRLIAGYLFYAVIISFYLDAFGPTIYFLIKVIIITKVVEFLCYRSTHCSSLPEINSCV